jgi:hypothetical protein
MASTPSRLRPGVFIILRCNGKTVRGVELIIFLAIFIYILYKGLASKNRGNIFIAHHFGAIAAILTPDSPLRLADPF